jgi:hypothetical protein
MNLDADWPDASGVVWFIYVKQSDVRGIFPEGHIISCSSEKPIGDPNFGGGILHSIAISVDPGIWGRIIRGEMMILNNELVIKNDPRRSMQWQAQQDMLEEI